MNNNTTPQQTFFDKVTESINKETFVKLTLSKPAPKSADLRNIYIRLVALKDGLHLSFTYHYQTKDIVKNYEEAEAQALLSQYLGKDFLIGTLLTTEADWVLLYNKKRKARLQKRRASTTEKPSLAHDRERNYMVEEAALFLEKLGIAKEGTVFPRHRDKFRQINKYIEIMDGLLTQVDTDDLSIVDMGSGKGYLTFALYDYLRQKGKPPKIRGIELREHLVTFCNQQAASLAWEEQLQFEAKDILEYNNDEVDVLIALHACNTATDIAIAKGIAAEAQLIVTAPCCHKQIRQEMNPQNSLQAILQHGILEERQAEIITDGIRALLLEAHGYQTKVFEFVSSEHTAKNLMITAVKHSDTTDPSPYLAEVKAIKASFGIGTHYLKELLEELL